MSDDLIHRIEEIPLSGDDLLEIAACLGTVRSKYMLYGELVNFRSLAELFGDDPSSNAGVKTPVDSIYILLQIKNQEGVGSVGHWVCFIFNRDKHEYYWFDPYGLQITEELSITHEPDTILRLTSGVTVDQNDVRHQAFSHEVNTCGRHAVLRSVFFHLNNTEYDKKVMRPIRLMTKSGDTIVALMTGLASKSDAVLIKHFNKSAS